MVSKVIRALATLLRATYLDATPDTETEEAWRELVADARAEWDRTQAALVAANASVEALSKSNVELGAQVLQLEAVLREVGRCGFCAGAGGIQTSAGPRLQCGNCAGTGLHPRAREVLG